MDLKTITNSALAREAHDRLLLFIDPQIQILVNEADGVAEVEDRRFSYAGGQLVLLGFCPKCSQEVPSTAIRNLADLGAQMRAFRPGRHDCMDVD
jgi:hypothetical protein